MSEVIIKAMQEHAEAVAEFKSGVNDQISALKKEQSSISDALVDLAQKGISGGLFHVPASPVMDLVKHETVDAMRQGRTKSAIVPLAAGIPMIRKAVVGDAGGVGDDPYSVMPNRAPGIFNDPRRPLRLLDLLQRIAVGSNSFEFVALDGFVNASNYQLAEGETKATQTLPTEVISVPVVTIAAVLSASEQVLADSPALGQFIQSKLLFGVLEKLEAEIVSGAGGTGKISGLVTQATAFTPTTGLAAADAIGEAIAQLEITGWMPGAVVLHPSDWQAIRAERNTSGDEYVATGWNSPAQPNLWGVPVVSSAVIAQGTALVLDPAHVALLDRQSANVQIGYTGDQFAQNLLSLRAELRAGLAVMAPSAVLKLTI